MKKALKTTIAERIAKSKDLVFLTREFLDLGGRDQVIRALRKLCEEGVVIRIGYGLYAKAERDKLTNEVCSRPSPSTALRQSLDKLGVEWEESCSIRDYNSGRSTQIPVNPVPVVKGRFNRKIVVDGRVADYDRA